VDRGPTTGRQTDSGFPNLSDGTGNDQCTVFVETIKDKYEFKLAFTIPYQSPSTSPGGAESWARNRYIRGSKYSSGRAQVMRAGEQSVSAISGYNCGGGLTNHIDADYLHSEGGAKR